MKTRPITPARSAFGSTPGAAPPGPASVDVAPSQAGALAQARHVFLHGNGLPGRWSGRAHFVVLEIGFGWGHNFIATWDAWRSDPQRCERLFYVSVERHPPTRNDLARAHAASPSAGLAAALAQGWPPLTPNLHVLDFAEGRVQLLLALGDVAALLPGLRVRADAFFLSGDATEGDPAMRQPRVLKALGRKAAAGATLATRTVARDVCDGLTTAGFDVQRAAGIGGAGEITVARWQPRFAVNDLPSAAVPTARDAVVVGAGIAGAAAAQALARLGLRVTVLERHAAPASEASGNLAGLFHGTVNPDDGPYARLYRAAALHAQGAYAGAIASGQVGGQVDGLLRLDAQPGAWAAMQRVLNGLGLPPDYVQALSTTEASRLAGVPLSAPAWWYPGGGWVAPADWSRQALAAPGVQLQCGLAAQRVQRGSGPWQVLDAQGRTLACAPVLVLACAASVTTLLGPMAPSWPLHHTRGQVTHWDSAGTMPLRRPVAGDGYAIPLADGGLLCGATREDGEPGNTAVRPADHQHNLERLWRLTGLTPPGDAAQLQGRTGWRLHADDRLPLAGALPARDIPPGQRLDQARLWPRQNGLFVLTALGARGLTLAPLLARLVAAQATGTPWPLEQDLADAIDPARFGVRAVRAQCNQLEAD